MRLSLRFIIPLVIVFGMMAFGVVPLVDPLTFKWFLRDTDIRAQTITNTLQESLVNRLQDPRNGGIQRLFNRVVQDERLFALALCDSDNRMSYATATFPKSVRCEAPLAPGQFHS